MRGVVVGGRVEANAVHSLVGDVPLETVEDVAVAEVVHGQ